MAEAVAARLAPTPWLVRIYAQVPLSPVAVGLLLAAALLLFWILLSLLVPGTPAFERPLYGTGGWAETAVRCLLFGYTPTLLVLGRRGAARDLEELRPALDCSREAFAELRRRILDLDARRLRWTGLLGLVISPIGLHALADRAGLAELSARFGPSVPIWDMIWFAMLGWLLARAVHADLDVARAFSEIGARWLRFDLLELRPIAPLVRWGLRTVLLWAVWFFVVQLFWINVGPGNVSNLIAFVPLVVVALAALVIPVHGVRRRLVAAKREELERLDVEIRSERAGLFGERRPADASDARLANLVTYRSLVEGVRTWPFDVSTLLRFGLYLLLGLASWLGAAAVERLLDAALR